MIPRADLIEAARKYFGPENPDLSSKDEFRFGTKGSKKLDLKKQTWHDFEADEGGGYVELFKRAGLPLPNNGGGRAKTIVAEYDYRDERGKLLFQVVRLVPRSFPQRRPDGTGGWIWKLGKIRRVPYRLPELLAADPDQPIFVAEGEKDVENLRALGLVATTNPGGAAEHKDKTKPYRGKWRGEYNQHFRGRDAVVLPDNDDAGRDHAKDVAARLVHIARSVRILELPGLPDKGDVSDWLAQGHAKDELVALAQTAPKVVAPKPPIDTSDGFNLDPETGLWFRADGADQASIWLCAPFEILGDTADERDCEHGLWLAWADHRNARHTYALPMRLIHADGGGLAGQLHSMGLRCNPSRKAYDLIKRFFGTVRSDRHLRSVVRAGWHGSAYVLPDGRVFGADKLVMQSGHAVSVETYAARGTLTEWQHGVARYATANHRLTLAISAAFAPPLLEIVNTPSGGVHFHGSSQIGKTTLQQCAASVWGPAEQGLQVRSWRATANGLEGTAAERCDGLLPLDETNQAEPNDVIVVVYMLSNQQGKARAGRSGAAIPPMMWRLIFISSGEQTIAATLAEARKRLPAGAEVRLLNIPADAGAGMGVWANLHGFSSGAALTDHLRAATVKYCGTAGPEFLQILVELRQNDARRLAETLQESIDGFLKDALPPDADGQVRSAAVRFGLVAVAGELATSFGILPWQQGEARAAATAWFKLWIAGRGGTGAAEDIATLSRLRSLLSAHGSARFAPAQKPLPNKWGDEPELPRINKQLGYVSRKGDDVEEYWVLASLWPEVCGSLGLEPGNAAAALRRKGYLLGATDKQPADSQRVWGNRKRVRVYRISSAILADAGNEAPNGAA